MKPAPFTYHRARSLEEALALLSEDPEAKPLAGGQSLIPAMNFRLAQPATLVDLNAISAMRGIERTAAGALRIGAMTRHQFVERSELVRAQAPLLAEAMPHVAHPQIRSRGTIGGSLAHADPSAELPAVMLALDARFLVKGPRAERWIPAAEFFTGLFETALAKGELLTAIEIPARTARSGSSFLEVARRHGDYALAGAAALLDLDPTGKVARVRLALLSVGDSPVLSHEVESLLGHEPTEALIRDAAELVRAAVDPPTDIHADAGYRRHLAAVLTRRALAQAAARAATRSTT